MTKRTDHPSSMVRMRVMKRDRFQCTYCGAPGTDVELEVDHIIPVAGGGSNHMSNLTTACRACNQQKSDGPAPKQIRRAPAPERQGFIGMFLHTFKEGRIDWQGKIISKDADVFLVQLYSWMDGGPTNVVMMSMDDIKAARLYGSSWQMNHAYFAEQKRMGELVGTIEECMAASEAFSV